MAQTSDVTCIADVKAVLGEGPVWDGRESALYWVDIEQALVWRWSNGGGARQIDPGVTLCSLAPRASGSFVGACDTGFVFADPTEGRVELVDAPEADRPSNRFNDGKTDREGRFWAGTMDRAERDACGSLYRLGPDLVSTRIDSGYRVTNGPAFSLDGRIMYHSDSALRTIYAFDLAADGSASDRRVFARFSKGEGYPDGMTVDAEDCLWIAFWDGWCLRRLSAAGEVIAELPLPVQRPTSCAFGGSALDQLFITSARRGLSEERLAMQPSAGGLFMTMPAVPGVAETPFAG